MAANLNSISLLLSESALMSTVHSLLTCSVIRMPLSTCHAPSTSSAPVITSLWLALSCGAFTDSLMVLGMSEATGTEMMRRFRQSVKAELYR